MVLLPQSAQAQGAPDPAFDPVAAKLVLFYRLLTPGGGSLQEIAGFLHDNPRWPSRHVLIERRDEALARTADPAQVTVSCDVLPPVSSAGWERCAEAHQADGDAGRAAADIHQAWRVLGRDSGIEAAFRQRWARLLGPADVYARFEAEIGDPPAAARMLGLLTPADHKLAQARLALRSGNAKAAIFVHGLTDAQRADPGLLLDEAVALTKLNQTAPSIALWQHKPLAALATPEAWKARERLLRDILPTDPADAYMLADGFHANGEAELDAQFLAGWIALRRLNDPLRAIAHFQALTKSASVITQARAHYWLGRALQAAGNAQEAGSAYATAATWGTTYYGQLATRALGRKFDPGHDPRWNVAQAFGFLSDELTRSVLYLTAWGEPDRAIAFLRQLGQSPDPTWRAMAAHLALNLHKPAQAVAIARLAGRDGVMLPDSGWPAPFQPAGPNAAQSLAVARQESSFDPQAMSPAGAQGLMQLLPGTAREMARSGNIAAAPLNDPHINLILGGLYLRHLRDRFGGADPLVFAAYNAGPGRVHSWIGKDDVYNPADPIDWVEQIPFAETRNYVQRVMENKAIYERR